MSFDYDSEDSEIEGMEKKTTEEKIEPSEPGIDDILALFPIDPSEKEIRGWFHGFEEVSISASDCSSSTVEAEKTIVGEDGVFAKLNFVWNSSVIYGKTSMPCDKVKGSGFMEEFLSLSHVENRVFDGNGDKEAVPDCSLLMDNSSPGEDAFDAMSYSLRFLGVEDLLSVERVCRSLRRAVRNNLLWRKIYITWPLNQKITDDALVKLTSRAEGNLDCLNLVQCLMITDDGLKRVLDSNPKLRKLSLPGCHGISADCILNNLRAAKSAGALRIKLLRIYGISGLTKNKLDELKSLLGEDNKKQLTAYKPMFYHDSQTHVISNGDDRAIDVDLCPKCQCVSLVYDCPAKSCRQKHQSAQLCRACRLCVDRCSLCGCCDKDSEYMEEYFLRVFCSDCYYSLLDYREKPGEKAVSPTLTFYIFG
ncbi:hypothetical protein L484_017659 [Morus notabilis]|uniref:F-box domain-containing protein n=1 Tax=Morus notabilis TaxID=981085 RepID=W9SIY6_9ROSA|nr:F-box protein SKIP14 [Morus notabilis]EXC31378.1 hypothetical protein L484_017659 [Morus notabilis]